MTHKTESQTFQGVLIADQQQKVCYALSLLLRELGIEVVGKANNANDLIRKAGSIRPQIIIADWDLLAGEVDAVNVIQALLEIGVSHVITLGVRPESRNPAMAAGSSAFVSKGETPEKLLEIIRRCQRDSASHHTKKLAFVSKSTEIPSSWLK